MDAAKGQVDAATLASDVLASHEERMWAIERLLSELVRSHNDVVHALSGVLHDTTEHKDGPPSSPTPTVSVASGPTITYTIVQLKQMRHAVRALNTSADGTNSIPRKISRSSTNTNINSNASSNRHTNNTNNTTNNTSRGTLSKRSPLQSPTPTPSARQHRRLRDAWTARPAEPEVTAPSDSEQQDHRQRRVQRGGGAAEASMASVDKAAATEPCVSTSASRSPSFGGVAQAVVSAPSPTTATRRVNSDTGTGGSSGVDIGVGTGSANSVEVSKAKTSPRGRYVHVGGTLTVRIVD